MRRKQEADELMVTASQFAWSTVLPDIDLSLAAPPEPRRGARYGTSDTCWLCGGSTDGVGWVRDVWLTPTFTNHNEAQSPGSDSICQACVAMSIKPTWEAYVSAHPEQGLKTGHAMSWRSYSHVFAEGRHRCPRRPEWRSLLTSPPAPPFLLVLSASGQKHLIFKARVGHDRSWFPLRWENEQIWIKPDALVQAINAVEEGMAIGLARSDMESLQPATHRALKAGVRRTAEAIDGALPHHQQDPRLYALACHVAHKPSHTTPATTAPATEDSCSTDSTPTTKTPQRGLF